MNSSGSCSVPLPPSLPVTGSLPTRRIQTEAPPEPPACVQNAMMTKDKKPFTYTPGGIDLSQIKSPRMAKRIARNAQYEGVTNQPKPSPLAQNNLAPAPLGASALGMPVQVFPTGPPPPPPPPQSTSSSSSVPPPPPPPIKTQLAPQTNGRDTRKSPTPQSFEPPPLGCRPEIKIPSNPMATLKKVPKPQPKNDFWVDEYRKERSKSPLINENNQETSNEVRHEAPRMPSPPKQYAPTESSDPRMDINRIAFQQQNHQRPFQQGAPTSQQQMYSPHTDVNRLAYQHPVRSPSPPKQQYQQQIQQQLQQQQQQLQQQQQSMQRAMPQHQQQRPASPVRTPAGQYQQQRQPSIANRVDSPFRSQDNPDLQRPLSPIKAAQQTQPTYYMRQNQPRQDVTSPPPQQRLAQVGSIYIPPVAPENLAINSDQQSRQTPNSSENQQQTPPWLAQRANLKENPDWIREVNSPPAMNRTQTPPTAANQSGPGLRIQLTTTTSSNPKERIIPIQIEKTPTPTRTPSTPGFGPQPYYTSQQQYGSVPSPGSGYSSPGGNAARNPNQFVDQGYNSYPSQQQQRVMSPPVQQQLGQSAGARIVPITIEKQDGPFNPNVVRGPIAQSPTVIQNDPRTLQQQQSWSNGAPNQSKSFRVLQKITDTDAIGKDSDGEQSVVELQRPQYSRQMVGGQGGAGNDSSPAEQMRRMQLNNNDQDQGFVNRVSVQRQPQRYVQQRSVNSQDEQPQQYIHPSEQQVHEPKIYTGSAIPSRSFKILQAMTTPENAGPGQSDL